MLNRATWILALIASAALVVVATGVVDYVAATVFGYTVAQVYSSIRVVPSRGAAIREGLAILFLTCGLYLGRNMPENPGFGIVALFVVCGALAGLSRRV